MIILCDTREQAPLDFKHPYIEGVEHVALFVGDYCVRYNDAHQPPIYFERKSLPDLFSSLGKNYKRFRREIKRSQDKNNKLIIIIEGTITDILKGTPYSLVQGIQILRSLLTLWNKYEVVSVFCKNREEMATFIAEYYCAYARKRLRNVKK